ncbi:uncharacterized protein LOC9638407 isoform X2 [Selaginella moellendorffii]|uniref:uncharacterized protein LOC9638407 isoform X2 n=1 Tax=Selaginella moellendorffii TaxID=88036 RepID=UPI000D1C8C86|nr:uncharacterized protein LOC9638407 isoform X2 [Selaginella moellendorffii]|eukprot:XP_024537502.1 uncharacterized protein LOC9638407 isoform X2 [Selaginella moellendorffii]
MDLNVSLDAAARARKGEAAAAAGAASMSGMSNAANGDSSHSQQQQQSQCQLQQQQQQQRKRKANRDSWPFMHAIMLLECFKDVWTKSNMGNLTMAQWTEVSNKVNEFCGISMNEQQCRTKVDNLKKRYKRERMKYAPTGHTSPWEFYVVMNKLFGNTTKLSAAGASPISGQPAVGDGCGEDTEGSDEEDVVVLDNGGDLIFNIPAASLPTTSPQSGNSFGRGGHTLLLEGPGETGLDASPSENSNVVAGQAAETSSYQEFSNAAGLSPRLGSGKKMTRATKRKRDSGVGVAAGDGYGDLLKEVERERNVDWQRRLAELAKVDRKRAKLLMRSQDGCVGFRNGPVDGALGAQQDGDEFDDLLDFERRREELKCKDLCEAERKVDLASKALCEAQQERERLERDVTVAREAFEYRKAVGTGLKLSLKKYFVEKIQPAERINASLTKFPYYLSDVTRDFLVEALGSCLDQSRRASHLSGLCASSNTILLNGPQNSEMYQEMLVKAIAHDQGVALLMLDSTDLAPQDHGDGYTDAVEAGDDMSKVTGFKNGFRKGDRVVSKRDERQRGRVIAVSESVSGKIGILFDATEDALKLTTRFEDIRRSPPIEWHYASDFDKDQSGNTMFLAAWQATISALCEISRSAKPLIVYFSELEQWFERAVPVAWKQEIIHNLQRQLDKVIGNVALIATFTSDADEPLSVKRKSLKSIHNLFANVVDIFPPKDDLDFWRWKALLLQDGERVTANKNIQLLQKVLTSHNLVCLEFIEFQICDFLLTYSEAEYVVSWAVSYEYSNSQNVHVDKSTAKTSLSAGSLDRALLKLRRLKHAQGPKLVAKDEFEEAVLSTVLAPNGAPKFDDVGALEDVKKILGEHVVVPLLRPEHFAKGALACPCKGVLLYGPPGTGKTYLTKAVAAQSSANLFWLRGNSIEYKWLEDPKRMTRALFSIARRLAPSIIFLDEIDSIFAIQAGEAMTRFKSEFIYGWDRLMSGIAESVVVMAATCRPFHLDESVIQKFPKRLCVDLPDLSSREKILVVLLAKEEIENGFDFKGVAELTDGYSANDLKNLTVAAAYRPVREMLELEKAKRNAFGQPLPQELRPLTTQDFVSTLEEVNLSYNAGYLDQLREWDGQFGNRW